MHPRESRKPVQIDPNLTLEPLDRPAAVYAADLVGAARIQPERVEAVLAAIPSIPLGEETTFKDDGPRPHRAERRHGPVRRWCFWSVARASTRRRWPRPGAGLSKINAWIAARRRPTKYRAACSPQHELAVSRPWSAQDGVVAVAAERRRQISSASHGVGENAAVAQLRLLGRGDGLEARRASTRRRDRSPRRRRGGSRPSRPAPP